MDAPRNAAATSARLRRSRRLARRVRRLAREPQRIAPAVRRRLRQTAAPAPAPVRANGSPAAPVAPSRAERIAIITAGLDVAGGLGLEIGPSHNPLLRKAEGYNIRIADHLDQAGLIQKYGYKGTSRVEPVDYVLAPGRLTDSIPDRFDYIVASHVAEHTVCLISFLQDCETLLNSGGSLSLALPDMRYCFDRFRERTGLGRVIDVHLSGQQVHSPGMVTEHFLSSVGRAGASTWYAAASGDYRFRYTPQQVEHLVGLAAAGQYVDTHNWVFTPNHFRLLLHDLRSLNYISLYETSFTDTIDHEFFVTLSPEPTTGPSRQELVELSARELRSLDDPHVL